MRGWLRHILRKTAGPCFGSTLRKVYPGTSRPRHAGSSRPEIARLHVRTSSARARLASPSPTAHLDAKNETRGRGKAPKTRPSGEGSPPLLWHACDLETPYLR